MGYPIIATAGTNGALKFGAAGTLSWGAAPTASVLTYQITEITLADAFTVTDVSAAGLIQGTAAHNPYRSADVTVIIGKTGDTQAQVWAAEEFPAPLQPLTIANASAICNGTWNYEGASEPLRDGDFIKMTFKMTRKDTSSGVPAALTVVA